MESLGGLAKLLSTYAGRDKVLRTATFVSMMVAGKSGSTALAQKFATITKQIGACRTVLRLCDDIPMLTATYGYGLGKHERDPVVRVLQIISNLSIQVFFPVEHIAWAAESKLINIPPAKWWMAGVALWASSITAEILKSLRIIGTLRYRRAKLTKKHKLESPDKSDEAAAAYKQSISSLKKQEVYQLWMLIKGLGDLLMAVNWLPAGFLWSGRFTTFQCGIFGTVSSVVGLLALVTGKPKTD